MGELHYFDIDLRWGNPLLIESTGLYPKSSTIELYDPGAPIIIILSPPYTGSKPVVKYDLTHAAAKGVWGLNWNYICGRS